MNWYNYSVSKSNAKGNVALAKGDLEAKAAGTPTLMGELGAELVVSKGRYFLVGQDGAEFVNLDKDAIVFNHYRHNGYLVMVILVQEEYHLLMNEMQYH